MMMMVWFGQFIFIFFFKQKTAYEMRISDWSSDVCSSDLGAARRSPPRRRRAARPRRSRPRARRDPAGRQPLPRRLSRSEEHTSELQSLMRTSYAVFCLKKKKTPAHNTDTSPSIGRENDS